MNVKRIFREDATLQELMESALYLYWSGNGINDSFSYRNGDKSVTHKTTYANLNVTDEIV